MCTSRRAFPRTRAALRGTVTITRALSGTEASGSIFAIVRVARRQ